MPLLVLLLLLLLLFPLQGLQRNIIVTEATNPKEKKGGGGEGGGGVGVTVNIHALGGEPPCPCHTHTATRKRYLLKQELLQLAPLAFVKNTKKKRHQLTTRNNQ